ncbi:hypothetical protein [Phytohabitans rumicis]|uniref:hypothetical protein n=1 Tax=Phytohabitans rumicis TaxID=1076125 RepID=UPI001FE983C4
MIHPALWRRFLVEFVGTALLVTAVVGSGIIATQLSPNDVGLRRRLRQLATGVASLIASRADRSRASLAP